MSIAKVTTDDEFVHALNISDAVTVVDMFAHFSGPCEPVASVFKKLKLEFGEQVNFLQAQTDHISYFQTWRNKSCPTFSIWICGVLIGMVKGANAPLLEQMIREQVQLNSITKERKPAIPDIDIPQIIRSGVVFTPGTTLINFTLQNSNENLQENDFTVALVKPDGMLPSHLEAFNDLLKRNKFEIVKEKRVWLTTDLVHRLYPKQLQKPFYNEMATFLTSAPCMAYLLSRESAIQTLREMMGPYDPAVAKTEAPRSIRALHASDPIRNFIHGSSDSEQAQKDVELLFSPNLGTLPHIPINTDVTMSVLVLGPELSASQIDGVVASVLTRFQITQREQRSLEREKLLEWLQDTPANLLEARVGHWGSGPVIAIVVKGEDVINLLNEVLGPEDPELARQTYPSSLRAIYGTDLIKCGLMASASQEKCHREHNLFFPRPSSSGIKFTQKTLALLKPNVCADPVKVQEIKDRIDALGLKCVQSKEFQMTIEQAREFYREHVEKPFFEELTAWMSSAPIWALELEKDDAIQTWRDAIGPFDPEVAKATSPNSLRAIYGITGPKNAVHGSDSVQAAEREIQLVFGFPNLEKETVWTEKHAIHPSQLSRTPSPEKEGHLAGDHESHAQDAKGHPEHVPENSHHASASASENNESTLKTLGTVPEKSEVAPEEGTSEENFKASKSSSVKRSTANVNARPGSATTPLREARSISRQKLASTNKLSTSTAKLSTSTTKLSTSTTKLSTSTAKLNTPAAKLSTSSAKLSASSSKMNTSSAKLNAAASSSKLGSVNKLNPNMTSKSKLGSTNSLSKKEKPAV